jgi:cytochrome c-type biogenesis protein CcmI
VTYFYLSALVIVLAAAFIVCFPIIKQKLSNSSENIDTNPLELSNANVIKQRITELEVEVNEGLIDASEKDNAIRDLKLALVDELPTSPALNRKGTNPLLLIGIAIPAILVGVWVYWQSNQLAGLQTFQESTIEIEDLRKKLDEQGPQSLTPDDFAKFALSIRNSLRNNPEDVRGWSFLAMVNTSIGRVDEGIAAYKKALDIAPNDDSLRFKFAEALMLQGTEESLQNAARQLKYLVQKQPDDRNNRLLLTSVAIQLQDSELAVTQFAMIKNDMNPSSQFYQTIVGELRRLGVDDVSIVGEPGALNASELSIDEQADGPSELPATTSAPIELVIEVNISDDLQSTLPKSAYLIVFAQHSDGRSRAPLAVKRIALPSLPVQINLSNSDAMIPSMNLSSAEFVNITARISLDDNVMPSAGELEGSVSNIDLKQIASGSTTNQIGILIADILK